MFTNILLASDGSEYALKAAAVAATLASKFAARLTVINVFQPVPAVGPFREVNSDAQKQYVQRLQEYAISPAGRVLEKAGVSYQNRRETGSPAAEIVRVAEEEGHDLIVLGSRGLSTVSGGFCSGASRTAWPTTRTAPSSSSSNRCYAAALGMTSAARRSGWT